jgi:hypothetical protein
MPIFWGYFITFTEDFFVVELGVVSELKVKRPTLDLSRLWLLTKEFIHNIEHLEMLSFEGSLHG